MLVSGSEAKGLLDCPSLHIYVHSQISVKKKLVELLLLSSITIPADSIFFAHVYLLLGASGWQGLCRLQYRTCLISLIHNRKDTIAFSYEVGFLAV